ncbi:HdeA/HdeB family chaperone [Frigidibacter sp. SD6-1]|uniref:HdeA/HdeB family chaperone n=1 Tax=Frigidibacter sp. SD6-1 TaxID=3032581 RepID=UPI0024DFB127|nr:HdeA/HdeB family chaperone [Frigidibacter sp. SD6-1]
MTNRTIGSNISFSAVLSTAIAVGVPALAQNDMTGSGASDAGSTADKITCAELTRMDTAVVPGTLYFVAGYHRGQQDTMDLTQKVQDGLSDQSAAGSDAAGASQAETSTDGTEAGSSEATAQTGEGTAAGQDDSAGTGQTAQIGRMSGYFEIPVEKVMTVCGQSPERPVSDVVDEQRSDGNDQSN